MAGRILWMMRIHRAFCDEWGMFLDKVQFCSPKSNVRVARVARHTAEAAHARQPVRWTRKFSLLSYSAMKHLFMTHRSPWNCLGAWHPQHLSKCRRPAHRIRAANGDLQQFRTARWSCRHLSS